MIQDIAPHVFLNQYQPKPPEAQSYILYYEGNQVLMLHKGEQITFPTFQELEKENDRLYESYTYLFSVDTDRFYLMEDISYPSPSSFQLENTQKFRSMSPRHLAFAGITGYQLYSWYQSHRFCGKCGNPMAPDEKERMMRCTACGQMEYPKICPAVIVGITHGNRLLMSKYAGREYKKYALIAGFAEIGETIEETVRREVMEEVGLQVKNITYYKSQPWSFTDTLLLGFFAELSGEDEIVLDREELAMAEWFEREDIPITEQNISLTNEMILKFKNQGC
ncbi:MAG: NAD(+) diphosphatase [Lachnospiraceae bacterium]